MINHSFLKHSFLFIFTPESRVPIDCHVTYSNALYALYLITDIIYGALPQVWEPWEHGHLVSRNKGTVFDNFMDQGDIC